MLYHRVAQLFTGIFNQLIKLDPKLDDLLQPLHNKSIAININNLPANIICKFYADYLQIELEQDSIVATATITTPVNALILLALYKDTTRAQNLGLIVDGDLEFSQLVLKLFAELNIDWEELISIFTGDIVAHQLGNVFAKTNNYQLKQMTTDFLQEESKVLPTTIEVDNLIKDIDNLILQTDRLNARVENLEQYASSD